MAARPNRSTEEPWRGKTKVASDTTISQVSPVLVKAAGSTLQAAPSTERRVFEAAPTKQYDNLSGVIRLRLDQPQERGPVVEKRTVEFKLLPQVKGETRYIKADPLEIHPVGTRGNPAKAMPTRNGFQVSKSTVVNTASVYSFNAV